MKTINALQLRQSLGKVVAALEKTGEPILLERGRKAVGVIVSLQDFQERFVEKSATAQRERIFEEIAHLAIKSRDRTPVVEILRDLRDRG